MIKNILYKDKIAIQNDTSIPDENKVTDENMNEIKNVVNNNANELTTAKGTIEDLQEEQGTSNADITSLKTRVSTLETDNTKNKSDINALNSDNKTNKSNIATMQEQISDIQQEQQTQNANIEKLKQEDIDIKEELEKTKKEFNDYAIHGQASGEFIHLTDSAKSSCKIDIKGNAEQTVTEQSANTLDLTKLTIAEKANIEIDSISANEVTFHATNNTATSYYLRFKTVLKQGTYYLRKLYEMLEGTEVSGNNGSGVIFISKSDWSKEFVRLYADSEKGNFTLTEDTEVFITLILAKVANGKIRFYNLMLSNEDTEYVPFVPNSPSLDYPSEVETVKDSVKVTSSNKNIFNNIWKLGAIDLNTGKDIESGSEISSEFIKIIPNEKFTASRVSTENAKLRFYDKNKNYLGSGSNQGISFGSKTEVTFYLDAEYVRFNIQSTNLNYELLLELGDTATQFVAHEENSVTVPIQQEMPLGDEFDRINKKEVHNWSKYEITGNEDWRKHATTSNNAFYFEAKNIFTNAETPANNKEEATIINTHYKNYAVDTIAQNNIEGTGLAMNTAYYIATGLDGISTLEEFKAKMQELYNAGTPVTLYYKKTEATKLDLTQEQIEALEKLDEMQTYKNITNITTDSIAILDVDYKKDLETLINQVSQAVIEGS